MLSSCGVRGCPHPKFTPDGNKSFKCQFWKNRARLKQLDISEELDRNQETHDFLINKSVNLNEYLDNMFKVFSQSVDPAAILTFGEAMENSASYQRGLAASKRETHHPQKTKIVKPVLETDVLDIFSSANQLFGEGFQILDSDFGEPLPVSYVKQHLPIDNIYVTQKIIDEIANIKYDYFYENLQSYNSSFGSILENQNIVDRNSISQGKRSSSTTLYKEFTSGINSVYNDRLRLYKLLTSCWKDKFKKYGLDEFYYLFRYSKRLKRYINNRDFTNYAFVVTREESLINYLVEFFPGVFKVFEPGDFTSSSNDKFIKSIQSIDPDFIWIIPQTFSFIRNESCNYVEISPHYTVPSIKRDQFNRVSDSELLVLNLLVRFQTSGSYKYVRSCDINYYDYRFDIDLFNRNSSNRYFKTIVE